MKKFIVYILCCALLSTIITASPSSLDTSFNTNGSAANFFGSYTINQAEAIAVQTNNKIITAGYSGDNGVVVQYNNDGTLDETFNASKTPGYLVINAGSQTALYALALQSDGKIIVAGYTTINNVDNGFINRYNRDGSQDSSFNNGRALINIFGNNSQLYGIALQPDGAIVACGWVTDNDTGLTYALVIRYLDTGVLDTSFNSPNGYVTTLLGDVFTKNRAIALQSNGNIITVGQAEIDSVQQIVAMSYSSQGALNRSFNVANATSPLSTSLASAAHGLAIQDDQKIVIVGSSNPYIRGFNNQKYTIIRLTTDCSELDTTFNVANTPGYIISDVGLQANSAVIQSNGQIVTCGFNYTSNHVLIIIRYDNDGTIDPTFNFAINNTQSNTIGNALALQVNGKIIVSGAVSSF